MKIGSWYNCPNTCSASREAPVTGDAPKVYCLWMRSDFSLKTLKSAQILENLGQNRPRRTTRHTAVVTTLLQQKLGTGITCTARSAPSFYSRTSTAQKYKISSWDHSLARDHRAPAPDQISILTTHFLVVFCWTPKSEIPFESVWSRRLRCSSAPTTTPAKIRLEMDWGEGLLRESDWLRHT